MGRRSDHTREELKELALAAARSVAEEDGLRGLSARRIAREIGYTIGTIYNLFENFDDLILQLNGRTLDELHEACASAPQGGDPEARVAALAARYIRFTRAHPKRWSLLFEHRLPDGEDLPEWHHEKIRRLLSLLEAAMAPLFASGQEAQRLHAVRVLWSGLHGICSLDASNKLVRSENVEDMSKTLISNFIAGLSVTTSQRKDMGGLPS